MAKPGRETAEQPLSEKVYDCVVRRIVGKELPPGEILDRRALADELGVSVSPVVHAMARLESEGFLEILPRKVTRVRLIGREDFRAQMLVRNALECQAARVYCGRLVKENEAALLPLAREVDADRKGAQVAWAAEIAFHRALVALTGCPGFLKEYDRVMRVGHFVLVSTFSEQNPFPYYPSRSWHAELVKSLQTNSPDKAERALREHLESGRMEYLRP